MLLGNFFSFWGEIASKLGGAILMISSHIQNWLLSKKCSMAHQPNSGIAFAD